MTAGEKGFGEAAGVECGELVRLLLEDDGPAAAGVEEVARDGDGGLARRVGGPGDGGGEGDGGLGERVRCGAQLKSRRERGEGRGETYWRKRRTQRLLYCSGWPTWPPRLMCGRTVA